MHELIAFHSAIECFVICRGSPPNSNEGLSALTAASCFEPGHEPCLDPPEIRPDGWGTPFRYRTDGTNAVVESAGPDRTFDTADDLLTPLIVKGIRE